MPRYKVQITPTVFETVEANSPEEARRKVDTLIADKGTRDIFDKLYFDYDTGVNTRGIRRKLAQAEVRNRWEWRSCKKYQRSNSYNACWHERTRPRST